MIIFPDIKHIHFRHPHLIQALSLIGAMIVMMVIFCIITLFNTKGEPREAIVALSMLQSGDWILPSSFGGVEMPYKPPVLAWCIAVVSWICGGTVSVFTARIPSLLAAMWLAVATAKFYTRHSGCGIFAGWLTGWITITSFEVFRAATACRVDMLMTTFMVCAIYALYNWTVSKQRSLPWYAILLMSFAFLTKGPVGVVLPCLITWVYSLIRGYRFWPLSIRLFFAAILSAILPSLWYFAAYQQGGNQFLELVLEENIGRMTGTMSYDSHINPPSYNLISLAAGLAPYTLLILVSLCIIPLKGTLKRIKTYRRFNLSAVSSFALTAAIVIFVFYCIPKSKRSVYLLPMYPFIAWGITILVSKLNDSHLGRLIFSYFNCLLAVIAILCPLVWISIRLELYNQIDILKNLYEFHTEWISILNIILCVFSIYIGIWSISLIRTNSRHQTCRKFDAAMPMILSLFAVYSMLDNVILPPILSAKSDITIARCIESLKPQGSYLSWSEVPMLHFYTTNFYLGDRDRPVQPDVFQPSEHCGELLLTDDKSLKSLTDTLGHKLDGLILKEIWHGQKRSCDTGRKPVLILIVSQ